MSNEREKFEKWWGNTFDSDEKREAFAAWQARQQEIDELAAQVEVLREALNSAVDELRIFGAKEFELEEYLQALSLHASDCLRERDARVLEEIAGGWDEGRTFSAAEIERTIKAEAAAKRRGE